MTLIDDPTLALIARFVVDDIDNLEISDEKFLRQQVSEISRFIKDAPEEQRQRLILAWITEHAENYRQDWRKKILSQTALDKRCADCPLVYSGSKAYCPIHSRWVLLLFEYLEGKINSDEYVNETLHLLNEQKEHLKISAMSSGM